jgi:group I intron endonuclease
MYGIIYKATGPGGTVYIGQTKHSLKKRKSEHKYRSLKGDRRTTFQIALLDEGFDAFAWEQIDTADTLEELDQKEIFWIAYYDSTNPERGYNNTNGGIYFTHTEEARQKMSESHSGKTLSPEHCQKISMGKIGRHHSLEARRKLSETKKGHPVSEETRHKLSEAQKGKHPTEETRQKMSEAQRKRRHTGENQAPEKNLPL